MTSGASITRSIVAPSDPSGIVDVRQWLLSVLKETGYSEDDTFAVHLALEEAFYNAVQHGNKMDPEKKVRIDCFVNPDKVEISMTDDGQGFDPNSVPDCRCGDNLYKPTGRGVLLIRSYMDKVEYNDCGNTIRMTRYKNRQKKPQLHTK